MPQVPQASKAVESTEGEQELLLEDKRKEYILMYRRFAHSGPETLRKLSTVLTLDKLVPIAQDKECLCEVCSLTKIKHQRGKPT